MGKAADYGLTKDFSFENRVKKIEMMTNDTEDDIIDYIRNHKQDIKQISIQQMANELFIAPNSVMRLSKKLGYSGFAELKFAIQNEARPQNKSLSRQLMEMLPGNIVKTLDIIDLDRLEQAASIMRKARCCIFAGVGDSNYFCELLGKNLRCIDYQVQYYQHIHDMIYAVEHGTKEDALIIISARGENERLVKLAKRAREIGMEVISITHMCENSLAKEASHNLFFWGEDRTVQGYNVTDRTGLMMLIRLLSEAFWKGYD
jgi:DNA-binding MurR/RpiR family transcriptional regulator